MSNRFKLYENDTQFIVVKGTHFYFCNFNEWIKYKVIKSFFLLQYTIKPFEPFFIYIRLMRYKHIFQVLQTMLLHTTQKDNLQIN